MSGTNIAPGVVVVPLNLAGYDDLTMTFDFKERIGAGGFGEVWRTLSRGTGDWFEEATKVSFEPLESDRGRLAWQGNKAVAGQLPHPHLCSVSMLFVVRGRLWVSTELAEGNLAGLAGAAATRLSRLAQYTWEAAEGLDHLHRHGIVHNRVKPSNILIVKGRARVGDFDLAHPPHALRPDVGSGWVVRYGDPAFLAPEVLAGRLCPGSDQFALACTYATVRLGQPVFPSNVARGRGLGGLPANERTVLLRALATDPDDRFPSCRAFADALAPYAG